jgi:adenylate cyclase
VLSYAVAREADKRSLAGEALDRYRELNLVYELADRLSGELEVEAVARIAVAEASRLPAGGSGFLLVVDADGTLRATGDGSGSFAPALATVEVGTGIVGAVAASRIAEEVNDVAADSRSTDGERAYASLIAAPVVARGQTIGVLCAGTRTPVVYQAADLKLLSAIAAITGPALAQARVHEASAARVG